MISNKRVLSFLYQKVIRDEIRLIDLGLIGPTTKFILSYNGGSQSAYTQMVGKAKDTYKVVIGGGMVAQCAIIPASFATKAALKPFIKPIKASFKALNYHEMGHVRYTDMSLKAIFDYDPKYRGFLAKLFNIIEDPVVEISITNFVEKTRPYDKSPRLYFNFLKKQLFEKQCDEYKDAGDVGSFMQYLLLCLRCGKDKVKGHNAVYDKYNADLVPMIKAALSEPNATKRQEKVVELGDWIIKNIKEFDWDGMAMPEDLPKGGGGGGTPMPSEMGGGMPSGFGSGKPKGEGGHDTDGAEGGGDDWDWDKKPEDDGADAGAGKGSGEDEGKKDKEKEDEDDDGAESGETPEAAGEDDSVPDLDDVFEDLINSSYSHEFVVAKDEYTVVNAEELDEKITKQIEKSHECVQNISKFLTLFKGRKKPRRTCGFTSGKLNVRAAMQDDARDGCETKLFTRDVARGKMVDLAVSLVCDNSGSMSGTKSHLASIAALALAQACDWANIPFEVSCFTKTNDSSSGTSVTIIEKSFEDTFAKAKPFFGINDSGLIGYLDSERNIPTFCGNSEEVNLFHIGKAFAECKHTTKLMFVFCDGCTTGSTDSLRKVIAKMMHDGIHVIGIGLCDEEVARVYPYHKIFNSAADIQVGLAPYLVDTLSKFATS